MIVRTGRPPPTERVEALQALDDLDTPVLIVGAGPVGLALAGDLAWRGIHCIIVEQGDGSIYQPKMDSVGIRTMEFCRRWGITDRVENAPYPRDYPQDNVYVTSLNGWELGREVVPAMRDNDPPRQSPARRERCPQDMFDPILRQWVLEMGKSDIRYEHTLVGFSQDEASVRAEVRGPDGVMRTITAAYLVGCDGAASTVRESLGVAMTGAGVLTYTTNAVFRCEGLESTHNGKPGYRYIFIDEEGTFATLVAINGRDRWRFSVVGDGHPHKWSESEVREVIRRAVGTEFDYEIESILPWVRNELVADSFQSSRVFLAGDSAHLTSPTGGLGMNTGIGDAVDLAWKLEAVLAGWGGPGLLASYTPERRPIAQRITTESTKNLRLMLSPRLVASSVLVSFSPDGDDARRLIGAGFTSLMRNEWQNIGLHLGLIYEGSPIVVQDGPPAPAAPVTEYKQSTRPGARAPHVWLPDGRSTLDLFGRGFVLFGLGDRPPDWDALTTAAAATGFPLETFHLADPDVALAYEARLVLVRPDGVVAWRGDALPRDVEALLAVVAGQPQFAPASTDL